MRQPGLSVEVTVIRHVTADDIPSDRDIVSLVEHALAMEGASGAWEIAIVLVDDDELRALHRRFMGIDEPTDVMTFPADEDEEREAGGDIVISVERAAEQGPAHAHTPEQEVLFLVVHGVLHLSGRDDRTDEERAAMLDRQQAIIDAWKP